MPEIKERPILFSAPMVRAILAGQKTVTRRVISTNLTNRFDEPRGDGDVHAGYPFVECDGDYQSAICFCPYGQPGDRLWVRESLRYDCEHGHYFAAGGRNGETVFLSSLFDDEQAQTGYSYDGLLAERSVPSIHLHRQYSRILLEVTDVRVERLQEISLRQVEAEGCEVRQFWLFGADSNERQRIGANVFKGAWESINGAGTWDANPWVWVVEFKRVMP